MKKLLAFVLAAMMMASLAVSAMALTYDPCDPSLNPDTGGGPWPGCPGSGGGNQGGSGSGGNQGGSGGNQGSGGGTSTDDDKVLAPTDNIANEEESLEALAAGETVEVKLYNDTAALAPGTMDLLGSGKGKIIATIGKMTVTIPGGFGKTNEAGRVYYPLDFIDNPAQAASLAAPVKGEAAKTEVVKAGGDMAMPTSVTITLKTRLTGTVNIYYCSDDTGKYTLLASPVAKDGSITFATRQLGHLVLTTGTI